MEDTDVQTDPVISALWGASYAGEMAGGVVMGGSAQSIFQLTPPVSYGGKMMGGSAICSVELTHIMTGGVVLGGTIDVSGDFISIAATMGGTAGVSASYRPSMSGGLTLGGSADAAHGFAYTMTGGISVSGQAEMAQNFNYTMTGGVGVAGIAVERTDVAFIGSGGVGTGGNAVLGAGYRYTGTGGVTTGGSVEGSPSLNAVGTGGVVTGGQATAQFVLYYTMTGGVVMGGAIAAPQFALGYTGTGGVSLSGESKALWGKLYMMTGGIVMGGQNGNGAGLRVGYGYKPEFPHNRVFLYGKASYGIDSFSYTMTGGIYTGGIGKIDYCAVSCDTHTAYYRDAEALVGCQILLPNGKTDYTCARPIAYLPVDTMRRSGQRSALVPSVTVCRQGLITNTKTTKKNCGQFIRK